MEEDFYFIDLVNLSARILASNLKKIIYFGFSKFYNLKDEL